MVVGKLLESSQGATYGYNAASDTYEDLVAAGIIDPLKVCTLHQALPGPRVCSSQGCISRCISPARHRYQGLAVFLDMPRTCRMMPYLRDNRVRLQAVRSGRGSAALELQMSFRHSELFPACTHTSIFRLDAQLSLLQAGRILSALSDDLRTWQGSGVPAAHQLGHMERTENRPGWFI